MVRVTPRYRPETLVASDYVPKVVTVPAPTLAMVLLETVLYGGGAHVDGSTYDFAVTYAGWTGETLLSPTASVVTANGNTQAVLPRAARGTRALGAWIYIRKDGGAWHRASVAPNGSEKIIGFGDDAASLGGVLCSYNASGTAAPGSNTAADQDGTVIADPILAPTVTVNAGLPDGGTLYAAYSYVGEDGAETALSPASNAVTVGGRGHYATARITKAAPSGAVFVNVYLSSDGITWHRQSTNQPLGYVQHYLQAYDAAGAAPSPSTPQSIISGLQQAWDQALQNGGGTVLLGKPGGAFAPIDLTVPLILRGLDAAGGVVQGLAILAMGGHSHNDIAPGRLRYVGSQVGVEAIVCSASGFRVDGLDYADPNSRVKAGLALCDFNGGGSFNGSWKHGEVQALAPGGIGLAVLPQHQSASTHAASEQWFERFVFQGNAWAVDIHGGQTLNLRFRDISCHSQGNSSSANSGEMRVWTSPINVHGYTSSGPGQYVFYISDLGGGRADLDLTEVYVETQVAKQIVYLSSRANNSPRLVMRQSYIVNQTGAPILAVYAGAANPVALEHNVSLMGNIFFKGAGSLTLVGKEGNPVARFISHPTAGYQPRDLGFSAPVTVATDATDLASVIALANDLKAKLKALGQVV